MRLYLMLFVIVGLITTSCQNYIGEEHIQFKFEESLGSIDSNLVDHFPQILSDTYTFGTTLPRKETLKTIGFGCDRIELWKVYTESTYFKQKIHFDNGRNTMYLAQNTSLLLIFSYSDKTIADGFVIENLETPEKQKLVSHNLSIANSLPIPLFNIDAFRGNTMCGHSKDFELFVLDAKPGKYIDEKYLQECDCLPEKWKHGYSKGVAMSDERYVIIYWVVVW